MAEYIDKDRAYQTLADEPFFDNADRDEIVLPVLAAIPAEDVVPVVRCKDCKYFNNAAPNDKGFCICPASNMEIVPDDFCSYGEYQKNAGGGADGQVSLICTNSEFMDSGWNPVWPDDFCRYGAREEAVDG